MPNPKRLPKAKIRESLTAISTAFTPVYMAPAARPVAKDW